MDHAWAVLAACVGFTFFPSLLYLIRGGGARFRRPSRERTLTVCISGAVPRSSG